ncbi:hypothetical protein [Paraburkholderia xenovorans]|jgi:hypothetical protein
MNKRLIISISIYTALIVVSAIEGWRSTYLIDMLPMGMPENVEAFIRFWLSCTGTEYLDNPDDMAVLALLLYWLIVTLIFALALLGFKRWLSRYLCARTNGEASPRLPVLVTLVMSLLAFVVSCDLGWYLSLLFARYTVDIPMPVKAVIGSYRSVTDQGGGSGLDDDTTHFAIELYWVITTLFVATLIFLACVAVRRSLRKKTS